MANASLNIPITGDASALIAEVNRAAAQLKKIQEEFNNAFTTKGKKLKVQIDESLIEGSIADLKQKLKSLEETRANISPFDVNALKAINIEIKTTQDEIKRLQNLGVKRLEILPPSGSIAALKKELADLIAKRNVIEPFRIEHLTDVAKRIAFIKDEIKRIEGIGVEIKADPISPVLENSIAGLQEKLNKLRNAQINIDIVNEKEIAQTNDEIKRLESEILRLRGLSIDPNGKLTQSSAKARQAITSLSLVAQDLPFGFIAIQNNLPAVLQTFTELETKNKGLKGTFKELASALVGPAGFFLAFSAITGAITYAVKEYGSLGNAVDALFGKLSQFNDIYMRTAKGLEEYNKNLRTNKEIIGQAVGSQQGLISKISALSEVVLDVTESEDTRKKALQGLQEIDKERFKNFDIEKGKYEGLKGAVDDLTRSILAKATADAFAQQVGAAAVQFEQQKTATDAALQDLQEFEKKFPGARKKLERYIELNKGAFEPSAPSGQVAELMKLESELSKQQNLLKGIGGEWERVNNLAIFYAKNASKLSTVKPPEDPSGKNVFAPQIDSQALDEAFNLDAIIANLTKYGNALINVNNSEKERKNALKELLEINPEYFASFDLNKKRVDELKTSIEALIRTFLVEKKARQDAADVSKINAEFRKAEEKGIKSLGDKYNIFGEEVSSIPTTLDKAVELSIDFDANKISQKLNTSFADIEEQLKDKAEQFTILKDLLDQSFFDPLTNAFEKFAEDGKLAFDDFGKSILKTITSVVAKIAATGIINLLANILFPGGGAAASALGIGTATGAGGGILGAFAAAFKSVLGIKKESNPNLSGIQASGMQLAGEVVFRQRGSDLVGVINRTNGTINRVG